MVDEADSERRPAGASAQGARQDRLKLALRDNLKRRKLQARQRDKVTAASSHDPKSCPDGEVGKRRE
jgi:hypothetical protein